MKKIQIETESYEFSHGKKPRGVGMWAFDVKFTPNAEWETVFDSETRSYAEAKKWAQENFKRFYRVRVAS